MKFSWISLCRYEKNYFKERKEANPRYVHWKLEERRNNILLQISSRRRENWKDNEDILGILVGGEKLSLVILNFYSPLTIWLISFLFDGCFSIGDLLNFPLVLTFHCHQECWFTNWSLNLMVCLHLISFGNWRTNGAMKRRQLGWCETWLHKLQMKTHLVFFFYLFDFFIIDFWFVFYGTLEYTCKFKFLHQLQEWLLRGSWLTWMWFFGWFTFVFWIILWLILSTFVLTWWFFLQGCSPNLYILVRISFFISF